MNPKVRDFFSLLVIASLGIIVYSCSFNSPFVYDDRSLIPYDKWNPIPSYLFLEKNDFKNLLISLIDSNRPILIITFLLNYIAGGLNPFSYHLVNLTFHILTTFLIYFIIRNTISERFPVPLFSSLVFLLHPVAIESVTYISSRSSVLSAFFYMIPFYFLSRKNTNNTNSGIYSIFSVIAYIVSLGCKEIGITLPLVLLIYDYFFISKGDKKKLLVNLKRYYFPMVIAAFLLILLKFRFALTFKSPDSTERELYSHVISEVYVFVYYLIKLLLPINLNIDPYFQKVNSFININFIISAFVLSAFVIGFLYFRRRFQEISFAIAWILITISPHIFIRLKDLMAERWLYLSLAGVSFFTAAIIDRIQSREKDRFLNRGISVGLVLVLFFFSLLTFERNFVWGSEISLWYDAIKKSPNKDRPHSNLGKAYFDKGMINEALKEFKIAVGLNQYANQAHYNLGNCYYKIGRIDDALAQYRIAIKIDPYYALAYNNLGIAYLSKGFYEEGIKAYKKTIEINPFLYQTYYNLGNFYYKIGRIDDAIAQYRIAIEINPSYASAYNNLGTAYFFKGLYKEAINAYEKATEITPDFTEVYFNLGNAYKEIKFLQEAITSYKKVLTIKYDFFQPRYMLASCYIESGDYYNALKEFDICLQFTNDIALRRDIEGKIRLIEKRLEPVNKPN